MSTKIYDAYEYRGKNIDTLMADLKRMRAAIWEETVSHVGKHSSATEQYYALGERIQDEMRSHERSWLNCLTSAVVYPYRGRLFVQFFGLTDRMVFEDGLKFVSKKLFKEFSYWNNTDSEDGVSDNDWRARGKLWDRILGDLAVPSIAGLSYEFVGVGDAHRLAWCLNERRAKLLVKEAK